MTTDTLSLAGEVALNKLYIVRGDEKSKIDLTSMMIEVDVYEDIFSNTMSASVTVAENFNLIHNFPIVGEELIEMEFKTPSIDKKLSKMFFVYKIGRRIIDGNSKHVYLLNLISIEALNDMNTKISRAFTGVGSGIVEEIFKKYVKDEKELEVEASVNMLKFVSPYWSPFKCINYASSKTAGSDSFKSSDYLFFETNQKFKFKSLQSLFSKDHKTEYFYDKNEMRSMTPDGASTRDIDREYKTASEFDIIEATDYIDRLLNGVYSFKVHDIDIINKTLNKHIYNYEKDFKKTKHLSKEPMHSKNLVSSTENGRIEWKITNPYVHSEIKKDISAEVLSKRLPLLSQTEMFVIEIGVPGRLDIECGDVVKFNLRNYETKDEGDKTKSELDKYYSGNYLITSIQHRFTQTRHKMNIQMIKESFESEIKYEKEI